MLRLEANVAGFGGLYVDEATGRLTVYLRDEAHAERAISAVRALALRVKSPEMNRLVAGAIDIRKGLHAFSVLVAWKQILLGSAIKVKGFVYIDADERNNRVTIAVTNYAALAEMNAEIDAAGVPTNTALVKLAGEVALAQSTVKSRVRPTGGGFEIENSAGGRCTLGWNVTTSQGESGFLTAGHCTALGKGSGNTGETIYQSDAVLNDTAGTVLLNPIWNHTCYLTVPPWVYPGPCTQADAMFVQSAVGNKRVAWTSGGPQAFNNARASRNFGGVAHANRRPWR